HSGSSCRLFYTQIRCLYTLFRRPAMVRKVIHVPACVWMSFIASTVLASLVVTGCGSGPSGMASSGSGGNASASAASGASGAGGGARAHCASIAALQKWQSEIDQFDGGFRPTGSPAHDAYISLLESELAALGVSDVHRESYVFSKWTPSSWSLELANGPSA